MFQANDKGLYVIDGVDNTKLHVHCYTLPPMQHLSFSGNSLPLFIYLFCSFVYLLDAQDINLLSHRKRLHHTTGTKSFVFVLF